MSATWTRGLVTRLCGGCGLAIPAQEPLLEVTLPGVRRRLVRCPACVAAMDGGKTAASRGEDGGTTAGTPQPAPAPLPFVRFTPTALRFDWRARASGEEG